MAALFEAKAATRRRIVAVLRGVGPGEREQLSRAILTRLRSLPAWTQASAVIAYHPMGEEIDVAPLLAEVIRGLGIVWLPRIEGSDLVFRGVRSLETDTTPRTFGILEPRVELPRFEPERSAGAILVLTPGLAFDRAGHRLGRGKGYYDRWLRALRGAAPGRVCSLAACYARQLLDAVPFGPGDERVDIVVTEREVVTATPAASPPGS